MANQMLGSGPDFNTIAINSMNQASQAQMAEQAAKAQAQRQMQMQNMQMQQQQLDALERMKQQADYDMQKYGQQQQEDALKMELANKQKQEVGQQRTRTVLARAINDVERQSRNEAATATGSSKNVFSTLGDVVGIDPDQNDVVAFLQPAYRARKYSSRAGVLPEALDIAKADVARSYNLTDPKAINRRFNLLNTIPEDVLKKTGESFRKGTAAKWWEFLGLTTPPKDDSLKPQAMESVLQQLEKKYKVSDLDPNIAKIKITTLTPELMNSFIDDEGDGENK